MIPCVVLLCINTNSSQSSTVILVLEIMRALFNYSCFNPETGKFLYYTKN